MKPQAKAIPIGAYSTDGMSPHARLRLQERRYNEALRTNATEDELDRSRAAVIDARNHLNRPALRYDPVDKLISSGRHKHAAERLRRAWEELQTGRPVPTVQPPRDPKPSADDLLPPILNMPTPADPKNRWSKAKPTMRERKLPDGTTERVKVECPTTWRPKNPKRVKAAPTQYIAEMIYAAGAEANGRDSRKGLWRAALDAFVTPEMKAAVFDMIVNRKSPKACLPDVGLSSNGRNTKVMKENLVAALEDAALYLDEGS